MKAQLSKSVADFRKTEKITVWEISEIEEFVRVYIACGGSVSINK